MVNVNESGSASDVKRALVLVDEIQDLAQDLPERAEDFGTSVLDQVFDIARDIEEKNRVTKRQMDALENMLDGVRRWLDR